MSPLGHANPNKRIDEAIHALGCLRDELKQRVVYALIGPIEETYRSSLLRVAQDAGILAGFRLDGYMVQEEMQAYIAHVDLCINLRYPNTEGASASLVEQMLAGKAVITNDTGWYAELPSDVTRRVACTAELTTAVEELLRG